MDRCLKKRKSLPEGASSKQLFPVSRHKMKVKESKFRSLHEIYKETSGSIYTMKQVEKLSKETQDLKTGRLNGKIDEESSNKRKRENEESLFGNKKGQKFQVLSRFGKKLPSESHRGVEKDNCIGSASKMITSTMREKDKFPQYKNQKHDQITLCSVQRQHAIKRNELQPAIKNNIEHSERLLKKPAPNSKRVTISEKVIIISEDGNQQSANIKPKMNIKDTHGGSSMQRGKGKAMNDTTRTSDKAYISENELNGNMYGSSPAARKVVSMEEGLIGKTCLVASYVSGGTVTASPMSGISTNSSSVVMLNNVEIQKQETISSNSIHAKSHAIESTGPSSTGVDKVQFWGLDFDLDTLESTKAGTPTSLIANDTHGSDKIVQINVTSDLNSSDGFGRSMMISNQPASPKERDFLSSIGHGPVGYLTPKTDDAPNMNSFSCKKTLSAAPPVPKERDFLSSFGHGASGSCPPPPAAAENMNSTNNNNRLSGYIEHQATKSFTVSRSSAFVPYNSRAVRINSTPLNNISTFPASSSFVPNSSAPSSSFRPEVYPLHVPSCRCCLAQESRDPGLIMVSDDFW